MTLPASICPGTRAAGQNDSAYAKTPAKGRLSEVGRGDLTRAEFERVVNEALESLPKRFADLVENVVIAVEDEPTDDDVADIDDDADAGLELSWDL